jgi:hypothetical protein
MTFRQEAWRNPKGEIVISEGTADWLVQHVLRVYDSAMDEHIKQFEDAEKYAQTIDPEAVPWITPQAARAMAQTFRHQKEESQAFALRLADLDGYGEDDDPPFGEEQSIVDRREA